MFFKNLLENIDLILDFFFFRTTRKDAENVESYVICTLKFI